MKQILMPNRISLRKAECNLMEKQEKITIFRKVSKLFFCFFMSIFNSHLLFTSFASARNISPGIKSLSTMFLLEVKEENDSRKKRAGREESARNSPRAFFNLKIYDYV
jgi:hypothetical protein